MGERVGVPDLAKRPDGTGDRRHGRSRSGWLGVGFEERGHERALRAEQRRQMTDGVRVEHRDEALESPAVSEPPGGSCGDRPRPARGVGSDPVDADLLQHGSGVHERAGDVAFDELLSDDDRSGEDDQPRTCPNRAAVLATFADVTASGGEGGVTESSAPRDGEPGGHRGASRGLGSPSTAVAASTSAQVSEAQVPRRRYPRRRRAQRGSTV